MPVKLRYIDSSRVNYSQFKKEPFFPGSCQSRERFNKKGEIKTSSMNLLLTKKKKLKKRKFKNP